MSLGSMIGEMLIDLTADTTDSEMDSGDELIAQKEIPLEPHISSEQDTSSQKNTHGANEFGESSVRAGETVVGEGHTYLSAVGHLKFGTGEPSMTQVLFSLIW